MTCPHTQPRPNTLQTARAATSRGQPTLIGGVVCHFQSGPVQAVWIAALAARGAL